MSVYIDELRMPGDGCLILAIHSDGKVENVMGNIIGTAVPVPAHGDLVDRDELLKNWSLVGEGYKVIDYVEVEKADAVIPADGKKGAKACGKRMK